MSSKANFKTDELVSRIVIYLSQYDKINRFDDEIDFLMGALAIIAAEQKWYYVMQLCIPSLLKGLSPDMPVIDDEKLIQFLTFGHRINDALCLKEHGREALAERLASNNFRLPARLWNISGTDRWVSSDTVYAMVDDIRRKAKRIPKFLRKAWITRSLRRHFAKLNARLADAVEMNLSRHKAATGIHWKRIAKASQDEAIHIRIHNGSSILNVAIQSKGVAKSKNTILPLAFSPFLSDEERSYIDRHFSLRFLSRLVFQTISQLRDKGKTAELDVLLNYLYVILLNDVLKDADVVKRLSEMGDYPTVVITAHGTLAQLPFAALHDGERYLAERFNIVQAAPLFADKDFEEGELDVDAVWGGNAMTSRAVRVVAGGESLPQIPYEIDDLRALSTEMGFPLEVWPDESGKDWNADTLRWLLGTSGIALLSAHMLASPKHASQAIIVSPAGKEIEVGDAITEPINAGLLLLSGCQSASFSDWFAPDESSLVSLCRKAGARSVVSTLWPARDYPARLYNVEMIAGLNRGLTRAAAHGAALRHVMSASASVGQMHYNERLIRKIDNKNIELRSEESLLNHPNYWACFILTGAWR